MVLFDIMQLEIDVHSSSLYFLVPAYIVCVKSIFLIAILVGAAADQRSIFYIVCWVLVVRCDYIVYAVRADINSNKRDAHVVERDVERRLSRASRCEFAFAYRVVFNITHTAKRVGTTSPRSWPGEIHNLRVPNLISRASPNAYASALNTCMPCTRYIILYTLCMLCMVYNTNPRAGALAKRDNELERRR